MFNKQKYLANFSKIKLTSLPLADPGGAAGARPPQQDQFLSFLHTFLPKSVRIGGWHPPPPQREILDPPLTTIAKLVKLL